MSNSFAIPWTTACQAPLSMGFPRQEYRSELPFPTPGDLPKSGIEPPSPALAGGFFTTEPTGKPTLQQRLGNLLVAYYKRLEFAKLGVLTPVHKPTV